MRAWLCFINSTNCNFCGTNRNSWANQPVCVKVVGGHDPEEPKRHQQVHGAEVQQPGGGSHPRQRHSAFNLRLVHRRISPQRISQTWRWAQQTSKRDCCKFIMYLFTPAAATHTVHVRRCASQDRAPRDFCLAWNPSETLYVEVFTHSRGLSERIAS